MEREHAFMNVKVDHKQQVAIVTINRPDRRNAVDGETALALFEAFERIDRDDGVHVAILHGAGGHFCAGADLKALSEGDRRPVTDSGMAPMGPTRMLLSKPVIAAVEGYALGGGCELAMMADFIIASDKAKFGQPEIKLGVAPGMGGSQRLTRAIGKAKAMEMCLTGRMMDAAEAERSGLVARVVAHESLVDEAMKTATTIAAMPPMAAMVNKDMVNAAFETTLDQGLIYERRLFQILAATEDKAEGMAAFIEKREGVWKGR